MKKTAIGCDIYNGSVTGGVAKTLRAHANDCDHVPCVIEAVGCDLWNGVLTGDTAMTFCADRMDPHHIPCVIEKMQRVTGTLSPGGHPGSYNGQDAYNEMLICGKRTVKPDGDAGSDEHPGYDARSADDSDRGGTEMDSVRRLTPKECERLQNFPDGWTDLGEWVDSNGKKHKAADSPRYKALGNSIALPFWQVLARRICAQYDRQVTMGSLFDGIGGFPLVFERCGAKAVWASEIEEFPIAVTKLRFPEEGE